MKCNTCSAECQLAPGESFCTDCGHAASDHSAGGASVAVSPPQIESSGTYSAEISRGNPSCLIFLVDHSGSMEEPIAGGMGQKKKDAVADAINRLIKSLILLSSKEEGVRHYFDVGIWTYHGANQVQPVFGTELLSIIEVEKRPKRKETRSQKFPDGAGGVYEQQMEFPIWLDPMAQGQTPMKAAFQAVIRPLQNWLNQHPNSFPPIIINLTDGMFTDGSPAPEAQQLMQMGTSDGRTLIFNCHISKDDLPELLFPGNARSGSLSPPQKELFDISSSLPPKMSHLAQSKGYAIEQGARGYVYNAGQVTMTEFLDVGTGAATDRVM